ncbi:unnamed protein product [Chondrus crispus]|uniref:Uncharacterized protein n=1 Tax=Chondrus crispus TaxID=2769 RepID=R7QM37_CHOCR|nr:unnamed protein product [Chondrus crispus]CDF39169.1 unnamed protein product [Chondrus crispus]|eukprot:XP_005719080.1 unnamed protein product [Chondrus crispus]
MSFFFRMRKSISTPPLSPSPSRGAVVASAQAPGAGRRAPAPAPAIPPQASNKPPEPDRACPPAKTLLHAPSPTICTDAHAPSPSHFSTHPVSPAPLLAAAPLRSDRSAPPRSWAFIAVLSLSTAPGPCRMIASGNFDLPRVPVSSPRPILTLRQSSSSPLRPDLCPTRSHLRRSHVKRTVGAPIRVETGSPAPPPPPSPHDPSCSKAASPVRSSAGAHTASFQSTCTLSPVSRPYFPEA